MLELAVTSLGAFEVSPRPRLNALIGETSLLRFVAEAKFAMKAFLPVRAYSLVSVRRWCATKELSLDCWWVEAKGPKDFCRSRFQFADGPVLRPNYDYHAAAATGWEAFNLDILGKMRKRYGAEHCIQASIKSKEDCTLIYACSPVRVITNF